MDVSFPLLACFHSLLLFALIGNRLEGERGGVEMGNNKALKC